MDFLPTTLTRSVLPMAMVLPALIIVLLPNRAQAEKGWVLQQNRFSESLRVVICKSALKATLKKRGWNAISMAPDWKVRTYNTNSKLKYDVPLESWLQTGMFDRIGTDSHVYNEKFSVISKEKITFMSQPCTRISFKSNGEEISGKKWHGMFGNDQVETHNLLVKAYVCKYVQNIGNERASSFLSALNVMPKGDGVPVEYVAICTNRARVLRLATHSIKFCDIDRGREFAIPTGYKAARSLRESTAGTGREEVDAMLKDLDFGRPFGSDKK